MAASSDLRHWTERAFMERGAADAEVLVRLGRLGTLTEPGLVGIIDRKVGSSINPRMSKKLSSMRLQSAVWR
jgi:hypothetical protein